MRIAGRYQLEELLGRGGMGEVWRAFDPQLRRAVAIKLLPARPGGDRQRVQRFYREAQVTANLQHPGITGAFDFGEYERHLFLVMELLQGRDLSKVLADHPSGLSVHRTLDLVAQVADALSRAHQEGIVHRDIKPANLMLLPGDKVKLCDFGIAGFTQIDSNLTYEGSVLGTPAYMAPEQCRGLRVDERADLYSLGCVLFALLGGRPPFPPEEDFRAVMAHHLHSPPPRMSSLRSDLPHGLDQLIEWLLAKDPADRPSRAGDVADKLRALRDGAPIKVASSVTSGLTLTLHYNQYLPPGESEVHAMVSVAGEVPPSLATGAPRAAIFVIGLSGESDNAHLAIVRDAVAEAIERLEDQVSFAVVAGSEYAHMVYPDTLRLVKATAATKAQARTALAGLTTCQNAAFGRWLRLLDRLFTAHPDAVRHAILLTDQRADSESLKDLNAVLSACAGRFSCDALGIGTDWEPIQLRSITSALNGTLEIVTSGPELMRELTSRVERMRLALPRDLALRISTPGGRLRFLKELVPDIKDLSDRRYPVGPDVGEYPIGVWGNETREYHLSVTTPPGRPTGHAVAAELSVVLLPPAGDGQILAEQQVPVTWVDDPQMRITS
ncbi:protein kinase domain-containing protein [Actinomadura monticuli]|uniref:non-specific serine/threonine protein kinase n=1 Tax=Actinomadura monticuli TaxID=3097367 RepID=A0ABV4QHM0_9ACTN